MMPTRCPAPTGTSVSSTRTPVGRTVSTRLRCNGFGALASSGTSSTSDGAAGAVDRAAERVDDAAEQSEAGRHPHGVARGHDLVTGRDPGRRAERHARRAVLVHGDDLRRDPAGRRDHGEQGAHPAPDALRPGCRARRRPRRRPPRRGLPPRRGGAAGPDLHGEREERVRDGALGGPGRGRGPVCGVLAVATAGSVHARSTSSAAARAAGMPTATRWLTVLATSLPGAWVGSGTSCKAEGRRPGGDSVEERDVVRVRLDGDLGRVTEAADGGVQRLERRRVQAAELAGEHGAGDAHRAVDDRVGDLVPRGDRRLVDTLQGVRQRADELLDAGGVPAGLLSGPLPEPERLLLRRLGGGAAALRPACGVALAPGRLGGRRAGPGDLLLDLRMRPPGADGTGDERAVEARGDDLVCGGPRRGHVTRRRLHRRLA